MPGRTVRQSGENLFVLADIYEDAALLQQAVEEAKAFTEDDMRLLYRKNKRLRDRIENYLGQVTL